MPMDETGNKAAFRSIWQRLKGLIKEEKDSNQVLEYLQEARDKQLLDGVPFGIIEGALQVAELHVRDIMIPRTQMVIIRIQDDPNTILKKIIDSGHSRFPVIGETTDELLGVLLAKDLLPQVLSPDLKNLKIKDLLRAATVIPESKRVTRLLNEFRTNRNHMAMVIDEYGGISGLVTIEDVLEEIVGEIEDEYDNDTEDANIKQISDGNYLVNALTPIVDFNQVFDIDLDHNDFDTIGGVIMQQFGRLPKRNDSIDLGGFNFKVVGADQRRILSIQVSTT